MADLRDLGLSSYEDRAYRALLDLGPAAATNVADASGVPEGRIYDVLDSLEARGMVRTQTASRPKQYVAVEPEVAINRLVETRTRELHSEIEEYEVVADQLIDALSPRSHGDERFWTTAIGTEDAIELLFERIDVASEQVVMVTNIVTPALDIAEVGPDVLDRLGDAIERGVDVSVLITKDLVEEAPHWLIDRVNRAPFDDERFSIRIADHLYGSFYLIDHDELCFDVVHPMERNTVVGLINLQDLEFAIEMEEQFRKHWEEAELLDTSN